MLQDNEVLRDCGVELSVTVFGDNIEDDFETVTVFFHPDDVRGLSLSKVGTGLQRHVYEALRQAYERLKQHRAKNNA